MCFEVGSVNGRFCAVPPKGGIFYDWSKSMGYLMIIPQASALVASLAVVLVK